MSQNPEVRPTSAFSNRPGPAQPLPQSGKRRSRFQQRVRRGLVGCLLFGVGGFCLANLTASWQLHHELAEVERRGEPLQIRKLAPPLLPAAQNAATYYLRAADAVHLTQAEEEKLGSKLDTPVNADVLAKNLTAIQLTRQAAAISGCRFPVDYDAANMAGILLPHLAKMRRLAKVLRAQARWEARQGQTEAALNDVAVMFRMSEHVAPEPMLISTLVAITIERIGERTLAQILPELSLSPAQAHEFALRLGHTDWTATLRYDLRGERCFGLWAFHYASNPFQANQLFNSPTAAPSSNPLMKIVSVVWSPLWKLDEVEYLHVIDQRSEMLRTPGASLVADDILMRDLPWYALCTRIMSPDLPQVGKKRDEALTYQRMALVALALPAYRTTYGHYPPDLHTAETAWGAALPHDLSTDQPFLYTTDGETMSLSSVRSGHKTEAGKKPQGTRAQDGSADAGDNLTW